MITLDKQTNPSAANLKKRLSPPPPSKAWLQGDNVLQHAVSISLKK